jgi:UTP--glucose-1-phosphate uridylyltransferase
MLEVYEKYQASVLALFHVERNKISSYGIASVEEKEPYVYQVKDLVEKPPVEEAPSDLAVAGRYIVTPDIFPILERTKPGRGGEIQFTDALLEQAREGHCYGIQHVGQRLDMGTPLGLLTTSIELGLSHPEIGPELREYLKNMLNA